MMRRTSTSTLNRSVMPAALSDVIKPAVNFAPEYGQPQSWHVRRRSDL